MIKSQAELYDTVQYTLSHENYGTITIEDPIGWESDLKEIQRSTKNFSTITKFSTNLQFMGKGAKFIKSVYSIYGMEANIILKKFVIHPNESELVERYVSILDGYTYEIEDDIIKINALESDLNAKLKSLGSEKFELENTEAFNGNNIGTLYKKTALIDGKALLLVSQWNKREEKFIVDHESDDFLDDKNHRKYAIPVNNFANSDDQAFSVTEPYLVPDGGNKWGYGNAFANNCFYSMATHDLTPTITIDIDLEIMRIDDDGNIIKNRLESGEFNLDLVRYFDDTDGNGNTHKFLDAVNLKTFTGDNTIKTVQYRSIAKVEILEGESLAIVLRSDYYGDKKLTCVVNKADITLTEDSYVEPSQCEVIQPFELFNRLLHKITGRTDNVLISDYFGRKDLGYSEDGEGSRLCIASGFNARNFIDKNTPTSWNDAIESYMVASNISYTIERKGFTEYVRIEPLSYFFSSKKTYLDKIIDDVKIEVAKEYSYSGIEIGYEEGGDEYEEAVGLDEFNGKHTYTTPLLKSDSKLSLISKYRADMTGFEFARRKPQQFFPTEDTQYDNSIFFLDLKTDGISDVLVQRKYEDDYTDIPINVYSPQTATNLRLSPRELLRRHGWFINNCLWAYSDNYIRFNSAIGNEKLILDGEAANDNIKINTLDSAKFSNFFINFTYKTDFYLEQEISDNINGIIEFKDSKGTVYQCRLIEFKSNKYKCLLINGI